ncbi:glycosyltransferase family 2 protein [Floridanema aerugineum]|uniref:Glycosyltransferase family 2 protein n=1 Tax=Floridaenema aerugineum BLCC-F46 TaxID=3153654 RepID=A0ABV4XG43_9CYAN
MPRVSIILLNYNYAKYLDERIQSLLNQTYKDFELIILDNGSTDNSVEIISKYTADSRIKTHFYSQNNPLFYTVFNDGIKLAQGEYVNIVCSDDSCHPTLLEKLVKILDEHPSVGLAYAQSWEVDEQGNRLRSLEEWTSYLNKTRWAQDFIDSGKNECQYLFYTCTITNIGAALIRRKVVIDAGMFDEQMPFSADWLFYAKILMISDIAYLAEHLNYHRTHPQTMRKNNKNDAFLEEKMQTLSYLAKNVEPPENFLKEVYIPAVGSWMRLMVFEGIPLSRNLRIYKLFKDINPNINYFLVKNILDVFKRKISIALKIKSLQY